MKKALVALGAVAALLCGCGGAKSTPAATPPTSPPTSDQSGIQSGTWTVKKAAQHYLAMTKQGNADIAKLNALTDSSSLSEITSVCQALTDDTLAMVPTAESGQWPDKVKPLMKNWAKAVAQERSGFQQCASAVSIAEAVTALNGIAHQNSSDETALVKAALGIGDTA